jgi:hypothetical protein
VLLPIGAFGSGVTYTLFQGTPPLAVQILLLYGAGFFITTNPLAAAVGTEVILLSNQTLFYFTQTLTDNAGNTFVMPMVSPWLPWSLFGFILGLALILISVLIIRRAER